MPQLGVLRGIYGLLGFKNSGKGQLINLDQIVGQWAGLVIMCQPTSSISSSHVSSASFASCRDLQPD